MKDQHQKKKILGMKDWTFFPFNYSLNFTTYDQSNYIPLPQSNSKSRSLSSLSSSHELSISDSDSSSSNESIISNPLTSSSDEYESLSSSSSSSSSSFSDEESESETLQSNPDYNFHTIVKQGKKVNVVHLLNTFISNGYLVDKKGDQIKVSDYDLNAKYVLIQLFECLPIENFSEEGKFCWALKNACSFWPNFLLIFVAKFEDEFNNKNDNYDIESDYFSTFLSAFPCSCIAVPLPDSASSYSRLDRSLGQHRAIVVHPNGFVSFFENHKLLEYGADYFPFTSKQISIVERKTNDLRTRSCRPVLLEELLGVDRSFRLSNIADDANDTISVSDLKKKLVGLYLFCDGSIFEDINRVYQECQAKNRELMIVLVYNSFSNDPRHFQAAVDEFLRDKGVTTWWVLPFNDLTNHRLLRLCRCPPYEHEQLIIVGPRGRFLEPMGAIPIRLCNDGHDDMYPYAAEALAQEETMRLRSLTLESLLSSDTYDYLVTPRGDRVDLRIAIHGKNVVLFLVNSMDCSDLQEELIDWCCENEMYECYDTILVVVPLKKSRKLRKLLFTDRLDTNIIVPWLICPHDPVRDESIVTCLTLKGLSFGEFSYVAFRRDGRISSVSAILSKYGAKNRVNGYFPEDLYECIADTYTANLMYLMYVVS